jgi:microcin C transport system permease protein
MKAYFIRRLLLIPPTLFGITIIVFLITRFVPGGPLEQLLMQGQMNDFSGGGAVPGQQMALSQSQLAALEAYYGLDRPMVEAYFVWLGKVLTGDLGNSTRFNIPVWELIQERFPISLYYGILTLILTYAICIPLGIIKAIKHNTWIDNGSSILIFIGYAIPGYVLGALLIVTVAANFEFIPMRGFVSPDFDTYSFWERVVDLFRHSILPLTCYMISSFALTTLLMKNNLMENLAADYIRTAIAKGTSFKKAVYRHALRNSLIPIATTFGQNITLLVGGSFLIERIFDIDGFGLLGFEAILDRDYPIVMGVLLLASFLLLLGNILSDLIVAAIDPRVRFR